MKNSKIVIIAFALIVVGVVVWYYKKKKATASSPDPTAKSKMPTASELAELGYNDDEIKTIMSSGAYKNGTLTNW